MNQNQQDNQNASDSPKEGGAHTVTMIVVFLFALVVVGVLLTVNRGNPAQDSSPAEQQASEQQTDGVSSATEVGEGLSEQDIQPNDQGPVESESVSTTDDLPSGIVIDGAEVTSNEEVTYAGETRRNVVLQTSESQSDVFSYYESWIQESEFEIMNASQDEGVLVGSNDNYDISISLEQEAGLTRVNMAYIPLSE